MLLLTLLHAWLLACLPLAWTTVAQAAAFTNGTSLDLESVDISLLLQ